MQPSDREDEGEGEGERGGSGEGGHTPDCLTPAQQCHTLHSSPLATHEHMETTPLNLLEFEEEDLLSGICPEDLSFSLNTSASIVNTSLTAALPSLPSPPDVEQGQVVNFIPDSPPPRGPREEGGTLFGLPETVRSLLEEHRGVRSLYGQWKCAVEAVHELFPVQSGKRNASLFLVCLLEATCCTACPPVEGRH